MNRKDLENILNESLKSFMEKDSYLIKCNSSERSICHRIASHLYEKVNQEKYHVDCEYNRNGSSPKVLSGMYKDGEGTVFPDIIIHKRSTNQNELVIEAKHSGKSAKRDEQKIKAYIEEMGYKFGVLLTIPKKVEDSFELSWWIRNQDGKAVSDAVYKSSKDLDKDVKVLNKALASTSKMIGLKTPVKLTRKDVRRITEKVKNKKE